jgi:hypothetical protein
MSQKDLFQRSPRVQKIHEEMLNIPSHKVNENQNHIMTLPCPY